MRWRHGKERWALLTPLQRDAIEAALLATAVLVEVLSVDLVGPTGAVLTQSLVIVAATAFRRSAPLLAVAVAALAGAGNAVIYSGSDFDFVVTQVWAVILLAYSVAAHARRPMSAAAGFLLLLGSFWVDNARQASEGADYLASLVAVAAPWLAGCSVRQARRQAQRLGELNRQLGEQNRHAQVAAAAAERLRIARELHDIVAHSLTVVALQADAADALLPGRPDAAQRAVVTIRTTAHDALEEMRRLLGTLRPAVEEPSAAPSRGLQDMEALVREAGARARVKLSIEGERLPLPRVVDEAAYRIVQEGLTNAHRHGDGHPCAVTVRYTAHAVEVDVWNSARGTRTRNPGFGLIGIQERVQALGGAVGGRPDTGSRLASARAPAAQPDERMTTVALADDQTLVRDGLRAILELAGMEVMGEAATGREALHVVRAQRPDVVLMDIQMPDMDGIEATRQVVQSGAATRVLILTTFDLDRFVYDAMVAGASGFLLKDAGREQIVSGVQVVASGDQLVAPSIARRLIEQFTRRPHPVRRRPLPCAVCPDGRSRCCAWSPAGCPTTRSRLPS